MSDSYASPALTMFVLVLFVSLVGYMLYSLGVAFYEVLARGRCRKVGHDWSYWVDLDRPGHINLKCDRCDLEVDFDLEIMDIIQMSDAYFHDMDRMVSDDKLKERLSALK